MANFEEQQADRREQLIGDAAIEKIRALLKNFRSAMLMTVTAAGDVTTRPMGLQGDADAFEGTLWLFADDRSHKVRAIEAGAFTKAVVTGQPGAGGNEGVANLP